MDEAPLTRLRNGDLPKMVSWYDPRLLSRIGIRTIISNVFGQYADQRLIQAATDPADDQTLVHRYDYRDPTPDDPMKRMALDETGAYWVDYIADVGDGFESTYAMAYLMAEPSLEVAGAGTLPHGDLLIMGGDQCYPQATREDYKKRLITPYNWAFDVPKPQRKLFALPGNHDWYDGLNAFDSLFCSSRDKLSDGKGGHIGGWQCQQHRSYWALRLPYNWWIWGCDIQFSKYLDVAQVNYFEAVARQMGPEDKLIICMAEPQWMLAEFQGTDEEENFYKITTIARKAGARICAAFAGDWHHYNRYYAPDLDVHFITAGGGGAFMHPTHVLKDALEVRWPTRDEAATPDGKTPAATGAPGPWRSEKIDIRLRREGAKQGVAADVGEAVKDVIAPIEGALAGVKAAKRRPLKPQAPKVYPDKGISRLMSLRNILFPFYNLPFAIGIGFIYWLITWEFFTIVGRHDISSGKIDAVGQATSFWELLPFLPLYLIQASLVSIALVVMLGGLYAFCIWYVDVTERPGLRRIATMLGIGTLHFMAHVMTMFALGFLFVLINNTLSPKLEPYVNALWQSSAQPGSVTSGVVKEVLEPLSKGRQDQRQVYGGEQKQGAMTRTAPPTTTKPGAAAVTGDDKLDTGNIRQILGFVLYPTEMILIGGLAGGFVWGLYWVITGLIGRMHSEEAFAALRIKDYKNFLRLKFERDRLTIFPIGIDRVPRARDWAASDPARAHSASRPRLVPISRIDTRLIEQPIVIHADPDKVA